jgi:hypothetical protein
MSFRKPNFFVVGAPKCGTTWLYKYLSQHPQVFMPAAKEPHYFNLDSQWRWVPELADYEALFADVPDTARQVGEASVMYLYSQVAVPNILRYAPGAKFIAMVRNPANMVPSLHQEFVFRQDEDVVDFAQAWDLQAERAAGRRIPPHCKDPQMLEYGRICALGGQVQRLLAHAGAENVLVVLLEDIRKDAAREFRRVQQFLALDEWLPADLSAVNEAKARRSPLVRRLTLEAARAKRVLGLRWSLGVLRKLNDWNVRKHDKQALPDAMRERLVAHFEGDMRLMESLLGRDLAHWRKVR